MEWYQLVLLVLTQGLYVSSNLNYFSKYGERRDIFVTEDGFQQQNSGRTKRFLTFNNDDSNIRVEIEFSVPFLEIPLDGKGSPGGSLSPMLSVNAKSAIVVTTLFFASYLLVPKLVHHFLPKVRQRPQGRGPEVSEIERLVRGVEDTLHVNVTACWQQGVCSLVQGSRDNTSTAGLGRVLDGLSSMTWLETVIKGSALDEAFVVAKQDPTGCQELLSRCTLNSKHWEKNSFHTDLARRYMNQLIKLYNSRSEMRN